jgi:tetratricopeptide (TPR) repeat protein
MIKTEAEAAVRLNPKHAGAYHILGRWHRTIAGFNMIEKLMINTLFGGVPEGGSYDKAIECFAKAVEIEPDYMLHIYELALSYHERGNTNDDAYAKAWLKKAILLPLKNDDDKETLTKCKALLDKLK